MIRSNEPPRSREISRDIRVRNAIVRVETKPRDIAVISASIDAGRRTEQEEARKRR